MKKKANTNRILWGAGILIVMCALLGILAKVKAAKDEAAQEKQSVVVSEVLSENQTISTDNPKDEKSKYEEAKNADELADQIDLAITEENLNFLLEKMYFQNGPEKQETFNGIQLEAFMTYMNENQEARQSFISHLKEGSSYSEKKGDSFVLVFPLTCFQITTDMDNTKISIAGFEDGVIGTEDTLTRGPLLPMEYQITAENDGWSERKTKKINADLTNEDMAVAFDSGNQMVLAGGHIVAIDAGHQENPEEQEEPIGPGSENTANQSGPGLNGCTSGTPEYKITYQIAEKLNQELISRGYETIMIRDSEQSCSGSVARAELANASGAEVFVSIHGNQSDDSGRSGCTVFVPSSKNAFCTNITSDSALLGNEILSALSAKTEYRSWGLQTSDQQIIMNWSQIPVTIVEPGYMTNESDDSDLNSSDFQNKIAVGVADGIDSYFSSKGKITE